MTITQKINRSFYPILARMAKVLGIKGRVATNLDEVKPLRTIYNLHCHNNQGAEVYLSAYKGRYMLIANTASNCGYTQQYAELQQLQDKFTQNLSVIAFPSNDFAGQEPGSNEEIEQFCQVNFGVKFPLMMKSEVTGIHKNAVFAWLSTPQSNGWNNREPNWNFCKYLVDPQGLLLGFFESGVSPLDDRITGLIR
jgi:glutathione peroxidase